ncbi:MAG: NAD(P)/FAD-dependent oxidoreductase, partial [Anaerolineales bacterium]|nr:NAD(P)/FAD-dependent oxidoreductase [Anaerolineales bacterium]
MFSSEDRPNSPVSSARPLMLRAQYDAVIVGAGPNGLAAAVTLAQQGRSVVIFEAADTVGGGTRTSELTLPGFKHDVCSAIHPLGLASPFFRALPLDRLGLKWIQPNAALAHPLDSGPALLLWRDLNVTTEGMGRDGPAYRRLIAPFVRNWEPLLQEILGPLRPPRRPFLMMRFGLLAIRSARSLAKARFRNESTRALFGGLGAHSMMPLESPLTSAFGIMLGSLAHAVGWPIAAGGSQAISIALANHLDSLGVEIITGQRIESLEELPTAKAVLLNTAPNQLSDIAGKQLPARYLRRLERYRYGPGVFKVDWALDGPIPWAAKECLEAGTVHLGGTLDEIAAAERAVGQGEHPERPFIILAQQSLFDPTRAPKGKHTAWAYTHVPNGSTRDMTDRIEGQIERFAPGFRDRILERHTRNAREMENYNPNYVGGDINAGVQDLRQLFTRPLPRFSPYTTPLKNLYLCSSATPPGGGVHGMCGYHAARVALKRSL